MKHYNYETEISYNTFINEFDSIKEKLLKEKNLEIVRYNLLKKSIINRNFDEILNDESLFNDVVKKSLDIIKYLLKNNVTDVPQYYESLKNLDDYIDICDSKIVILKSNIEKIADTTINNISIDILKIFIDNSSLNENDKINLLFDKYYMKNITSNTLKINNINIGKKYLNKYNYIIGNQSNRVKLIRKSQFFWIKELEKNINLTGIDDYTKFEILLYKLKELVDNNNISEIDNIIHLINKLGKGVNINE